MPRQIRAITFDVGGTLIEPWPSVGAVYASVAAEHGHPGLPPALLTRRFLDAWHAEPAFDYTEAGWARLVDATFAGLVTPPPSETFFNALYRRFDEPEAWRVFDDVVPALTRLRGAGLALGVISNWDARLRPLLHRLGLADFFSAIAISCEVGAVKPAREIFDHAARQLALAPGQILHVGDSETADVRGARSAGLEAQRLRRDSPDLRPGELGSLLELCDLLGGRAAPQG